jgi:hypothetical protein
MSGRVIHQATPRHECTGLPEAQTTWAVWQCDECGDIWEYIPSASLDPDAQGSWVRGLPNPSMDWKPRRARRWPWKRAIH